ncbi:hypothetical protein ABPG72_017033 [Tetrahymena utriculariae]
MKKILFEEIKKSITNPSPLSQMDTVIHIKKINQKKQADVKSVQKSSELAQELVEYYKMQQNYRNDLLHLKPEFYNSPKVRQKTEEYSIRSKTPCSVPSNNDLFLKTGYLNQKQLQNSSLLEQNGKNINALQSQHIFFDVGINNYQKRDQDASQQQRKQVIIRKKNQTNHKNQILNALAQNRLNTSQSRVRAESVSMIFENNLLGTFQKSNQRCFTSQPNEREGDLEQLIMPNFENSILANNFNNITCKTKQLFEKYPCKQNEGSPQKRAYNYFIKNNQKKVQAYGHKSSSIDLQGIQCLSQEYMQKNDSQFKQSQQLSEEKQQNKTYYDRYKRMSQPDMSKQKESEIFIEEYLKTIKIQNKCNPSKQLQQQSSDIHNQEYQYRPPSRIHTSISQEKQRNESPLTKKITNLKKNNQIKHTTVLSQKNSIAFENFNSCLFNNSQDFETHDFDDGLMILNQNKKRNQSANKNYNNQLNNSLILSQQSKNYYQPYSSSVQTNFPQKLQKHASLDQGEQSINKLSKLVQEHNQQLKYEQRYQFQKNFSLVGTKLNSKMIRSTQQNINQQIDQQVKRTQSTISAQDNMSIQDQGWLIQQEFNRVNQGRQKKLESKEKSTLKEDTYQSFSVDESCKICYESQSSIGQNTNTNPFLDSKKVLNRKNEFKYGKVYSQTPQNNMYVKQYSSRINQQNPNLNQKQQMQDFFRQKQSSLSTRTLILVSAPNNMANQNTSRSNTIESINMLLPYSRIQSQHNSIFSTQENQNVNFRNQAKSLVTYPNSSSSSSSHYYEMAKEEENVKRVNTQPDKLFEKTKKSTEYYNSQLPSNFYQNLDNTPNSNNTKDRQNQSLEIDQNIFQKSLRGGQLSMENFLFIESSRNKPKEIINNPFSNQLISNTINSAQLEKHNNKDSQTFQLKQEFKLNQNSAPLKSENIQIKQEDSKPQNFLHYESDGFSNEIQKGSSVTIINNNYENSKGDYFHADTQTVQDSELFYNRNVNTDEISSNTDAINQQTEQNWKNKRKFQIPISLIQTPSHKLSSNKDFQNIYFSQAQHTIQSTRCGTPIKKRQTQPSQNIYKFQYINEHNQRPQTSVSRYQSQTCRNKSFVFQAQNSYDQTELNNIQLLKPKQFELHTSSHHKSKAVSSVQQKYSEEAKILTKCSNLFQYIDQKCKETEINYLEEKVKQVYNTDDMIYQEYMNYIQRIRKEGQQQSDINSLYKCKSQELKFRKPTNQTSNKCEKFSQTIDQDSFFVQQNKNNQIRQRPLSSVNRPSTCFTPSQQSFSRRQITRKLKKYACKFQSVSQQFQKLQENISKIQNQ